MAIKLSRSMGSRRHSLATNHLVHKTSDNELIKKFGIGGFCFNKEVKLSDGEAPGITVVAVRAAKDYVQKTAIRLSGNASGIQER